jgi:predicted MPP superfamily phosphohydrolase
MNTDKRTVTPALRHDELYYLRLRGDSALVPVASLGKKVQDRTRDIQFYAKYLNSIKKRYHVIFVTIDNHFSGYAWDDLFLLGSELTKVKVKFKGFKERKPAGLFPRKKEVKKIREKKGEEQIREKTEVEQINKKKDVKIKKIDVDKADVEDEKSDLETEKIDMEIKNPE